MGQPVFITPAGNIGVIPEGIFFQTPIKAYDPDHPNDPGAVYYEMIAGQLPPGIQCIKTGLITGVPKAIASLQGVPLEVARNITFEFTIRAYTEKEVNGIEVIDRLVDRTYSLTITGQDAPVFITPAGRLGTYYDGTEVDIQIEFVDRDPGDIVRINLFDGALPPGLTITEKGLITGAITPLVGPPGTAEAGWDSTPKDQYPNDFTTRSTSQNFQFTLQVTDGKDSNLRTYEIYVYSKDSMTADTTDFRASNTWITADVIPTRTPVLLTPSADLGRIRADNYFFFKFDALDFDGDAVEYVLTVGEHAGPNGSALSLPPGLILDSDTGWLYGYIPSQGATENSYDFAIRVRKRDYPNIISDYTYYTATIIGNIDTEVTWLTPTNLGTIDNGGTSTFYVRAENFGGRALEYKIVSGSNSKFPQGLSLLPSGDIVGRVSFNTFALDGGTTTFDTLRKTRLDPNPTTFDMLFEFDVNAYAPVTQQLGYRVNSIVVVDGNGGYNPLDPPLVTISPPPPTAGSVQATAGFVTINSSGQITAIEVNNPGIGYVIAPTVTIEGNATAVATLIENNITNAVSVIRRFSILVNRAFNDPYQSLYIKCMPSFEDRNNITALLQDQSIFSQNLLYRPDDPNFGLASNVTYVHALGLNTAPLIDYVNSLDINHYWKYITLGEVKVAQALDSNNAVLYEVLYSEVIDNLVNKQGESVSKKIKLPYPVTTDSGVIEYVYPNSLIDMRNQVISQIGQMTPALPLWMRSKQTDGRVPGFVPCWVIAYVKPGEGNRIAYNFKTKSSLALNSIDFKIDRYELDRSQTYDFNEVTKEWIPHPPTATTFDVAAHYQLPEPNTSSFVFTGGTGYAIGDTIRILGSQIGGVNGTNNVTITVTQVDEFGTIQMARSQGFAPDLTEGDTYTNIVGTNIIGSGVGATWDLITVGQDPTIFDGGSLIFNAPADRWTSTDSFDKYLMFPKQTILG